MSCLFAGNKIKQCLECHDLLTVLVNVIKNIPFVIPTGDSVFASSPGF